MNNSQVKKLGLIVNPVAGMGGAVGLKGTDGLETLSKAIALDARPKAPRRAESFLAELVSLKDGVEFFTYPRYMGEYEAGRFGFKAKVIGSTEESTTPKDTKDAALALRKLKVDLLVFCGGDGTARDICGSIDLSLPTIGVPAGVKMYSAVFAANPQAAATVVKRFLSRELTLTEAEVLDVDEQAIREGRLSAKLYGYLLTPCEKTLIIGVKAASPVTDDEAANRRGIAKYIVENMAPDTLYILGPGTTVFTIGEKLKIKKHLLGVDVVKNGKLVGSDVNERELLSLLSGRRAKIVVTLIGGQGFLFGRGNQQLTPTVLRKVGRENIIVVSTRRKLRAVKNLRVDTGDSAVDGWLRGYIRVVVDYGEEHAVKVV